jgi:hypothetical protein
MTGLPAETSPVSALALLTRVPAMRSAVWLTVLAVTTGALAALYDPAAGAVAALFGLGLILAATNPAFAAPYLAAATPVAVWHPSFGGTQAPALEAAAFGCALGCAPRLLLLRSRLANMDWLMVAIFAGIVISGLGPTPRAAWAHNVLFWGSLTVVFVVGRRSFRRLPARRLFAYSIGAAATAEAIVALVQFIQGSSGRFSRLGGAIVYPQPTGTLEHPNALAPYLVMAALLIAGAAFAERGWSRGVLAAIAVFVGVGSILPFSRGGWIALAAALLVWGGARQRRNGFLLTAGALGAVLAITLLVGGTFGARLSSLASRKFSDLYGFRLELARRAVHIIVHHPLTGTGVFHETGMYAGRPTLATHPHDLPLGLAVFFGIPTALAFAGLFVMAVRSALRAVISGSSSLRAEGAGAVAALTALAVDGVFEYQFWNLALTVLVVTAFAYAAALGEAATRTDEGGRLRPRAGPGSIDAQA